MTVNVKVGESYIRRNGGKTYITGLDIDGFYISSDGYGYRSDGLVYQGVEHPLDIISEGSIEPEVQEVTLRDRFAMAAFTGVISGHTGRVTPTKDYAQIFANDCYEWADHMMKARGGNND